MSYGTCSIRLVAFVATVFFIAVTPPALAQCDYEPDGPDCPCFDDTGAWDPAGPYIQDIAHQTVGTIESCNCPGTASCDWSIDEGGKPYYQMVLGCNGPACAWLRSFMLSIFGAGYYHQREAWCSETISYWHRAAGIPYPGGYRTTNWLLAWHLDWQIYNVGDLRQWYEVEEDLAATIIGGRGRWLAPEEIDYENYEPGVTIPVPGSYVAIRGYDSVAEEWLGSETSHSLMIDEMWVHRNYAGEVFQVEVTLLEGNSSNQVKASGHWPDLFSVLPQGPDVIGTSGRKIYGFGVDLDDSGGPDFDENRRHRVNHFAVYSGPPQWDSVSTVDPDWMVYRDRVADLTRYALMLAPWGGPTVACSTPAVNISGIPDGVGTAWFFSSTLDEEVVIDIDLLDEHPLPIRGVELIWSNGVFPATYTVQYAGADQVFQDAWAPDMSGNPPPMLGVGIPIPALFTAPIPIPNTTQGVAVRYVRITFPRGIFTEDATLEELRFLYEKGPWLDDPDPGPVVVIPDCNGNGVNDVTEVSEDPSRDCNGNGIPDECDLAGTSRDCNDNGILDECDLASGMFDDFNANAIPDECESDHAVWVFSGTAEGGQVSITVQGFFNTCVVTIDTFAGQSAATVAANLAAAVTADGCLAAQDITAQAADGQVSVIGFLISAGTVTVNVTDPGLRYRIPAVNIPALSLWGLLALTGVLFAAAVTRFAQARRRRSPG